MVLSSVICGLESDTVQTIRTMRQFACDSGSTIAQFAMYHPYPGTKDFYEMIRDSTNRAKDRFHVHSQAHHADQRRALLAQAQE